MYRTNVLCEEKHLIGMTDMGHEGQFTWLSDGEEMSSPAEWCPGQPDNLNGNEHCGEINFCPGKVNDLPCDVSAPFICQFTGIFSLTKMDASLDNYSYFISPFRLASSLFFTVEI